MSGYEFQVAPAMFAGSCTTPCGFKDSTDLRFSRVVDLGGALKVSLYATAPSPLFATDSHFQHLTDALKTADRRGVASVSSLQKHP